MREMAIAILNKPACHETASNYDQLLNKNRLLLSLAYILLFFNSIKIKNQLQKKQKRKCGCRSVGCDF